MRSLGEFRHQKLGDGGRDGLNGKREHYSIMAEMIVLHSTISGKAGAEAGMKRIADMVKKALGIDTFLENTTIACVSTVEEIKAALTKMIEARAPKIAISGGDGFSALFAKCFFQIRESMKRDDYNPDVLFLASGTGNAISYCARFKNPIVALRNFYAGHYKTEKLNMLEVSFNKLKEITHFVSFGADGEILEIYKNQERKGLIGYIGAVLKYSFSRKLYNPFSRNDANYTLDIARDGNHIFRGRYEGGGVSSIPYVGYGFRPYPLATGGDAHMRFVLFGAILMPTLFKFTKLAFPKRPNRLIYDNKLDSPAVLDFAFDRDVHVQTSGDNIGKQSRVRVEFSKKLTLNIATRAK